MFHLTLFSHYAKTSVYSKVTRKMRELCMTEWQIHQLVLQDHWTAIHASKTKIGIHYLLLKLVSAGCNYRQKMQTYIHGDRGPST